MSGGIHRQIQCSLLCCCAKCQFCNIIRCGKIFVFLTKKHQKVVSLNVPFLLSGATFEIYSYEKFLQVRFSKVLWKESGKYFILCQIADGLYTGRKNANLFLRILNKVILKEPRFVQISSFAKVILRTCMQVFRQIRPRVSEKNYRVCQNLPFSKNEL